VADPTSTSPMAADPAGRSPPAADLPGRSRPVADPTVRRLVDGDEHGPDVAAWPQRAAADPGPVWAAGFFLFFFI
jgi:hypothetical protein